MVGGIINELQYTNHTDDLTASNSFSVTGGVGLQKSLATWPGSFGRRLDCTQTKSRIQPRRHPRYPPCGRQHW